MKEPTCYLRIKAVVQVYGALGTRADSDRVVARIKRGKETKSAFMMHFGADRKLDFISDDAIYRWVLHARYWELVEPGLKGLTESGAQVFKGNFANQIIAHVDDYIARWGIGVETIRSTFTRLSATDPLRLPTLKNCAREIAAIASDDMPESRFRQAVHLLTGAGALSRQLAMLHFGGN